MNLEGAAVDVAVKGTLITLSSTGTKLISEEPFNFKGSNSAAVDSAARDAVRVAHRRHIEDFKRFAEHLADRGQRKTTNGK